MTTDPEPDENPFPSLLDDCDRERLLNANRAGRDEPIRVNDGKRTDWKARCPGHGGYGTPETCQPCKRGIPPYTKETT